MGSLAFSVNPAETLNGAILSGYALLATIKEIVTKIVNLLHIITYKFQDDLNAPYIFMHIFS